VDWFVVMRMISGSAMSLRMNLAHLPPEELDDNARRMLDITIAGILTHR
jgi:hypothetical protein